MKTKLSLYLTIVMLLTILIQGACKKETNADPMTDEELSYISREEFMSKLQGEWSASYFQHATWSYVDSLINYQYVNISFTKDSCQIQWTASYPQIYPLNDPILCTLPYMGNIQNWTIINSNDDLILKTQYWCSGNIVTYKISFSNYRYGLTKDLLTGKKSRTNQIFANIQLIKSQMINLETIKLENFSFNKELKRLEFGKIGKDGYESYGFISPS